jgi:hypothetical protein
VLPPLDPLSALVVVDDPPDTESLEPFDASEPASDDVLALLSLESDAGVDLAGVDERASFLAHPLPLNTIAGADMTFRSCPPHASQVVGPGEWIPWMTSTRRPQLAHSYS